MAKRNHKNVRMDDDLRRLITARMIAENCTESEAIRSLILDGAKAPRPRPVLAQLASRAELQKFAALLMQWQQDFQSVRARLAMADPDPRDTALCASVAKWRKLADELEPQARHLSVMADAMARVLMGLDSAACEKLAKIKSELQRQVAALRKMLAAPDLTSEKKRQNENSLGFYEAVVAVLELFAV
jgi:hypothetical protein